jgi:hypothetical protein
MFPQEDTSSMYPTRIPFEESTVYSQININCPNLKQFPLFKVKIIEIHFKFNYF